MAIKLFLAPREVLSKINKTFESEKRCQLVKENFEKFEKVLEVPFGDCTISDLYRYTQNNDESWTKKFGFESTHRSSSTGDVFIIDDKAYLIDPFGFCKVEGLQYENFT